MRRQSAVHGTAALGQVPRDLLELLAAAVRELHEHDRLALARVDVLPRPLEHQVGAGHLGNRLLLVLRVVLEEIEVGAVGLVGHSRAVPRVRPQVITTIFSGTARTLVFFGSAPFFRPFFLLTKSEARISARVGTGPTTTLRSVLLPSFLVSTR